MSLPACPFPHVWGLAFRSPLPLHPLLPSLTHIPTPPPNSHLISSLPPSLPHRHKQFAAYENATVVIWDLNETAMQAVAKEIEAKGARAFTYKVDVTKRERVYEVAKQMKAQTGKDVTVLVNNAGIVSGKPFLEGDDAYSLKTMEVNVIAHFWTVKAFLPAMVQLNHGHIITIASTAGLVGVDGLADYCTSKSAAIAFHEGIRTEIRRLKCPGVRMTLVNPYFIDTGMFTGAKTKAPILLPILQPDYVANSILNAAEKNRNLLNMPRYAYILMVTNGVPALVRDFIYDFMGVGDNMADFKQTRTKTLKEQ